MVGTIVSQRSLSYMKIISLCRFSLISPYLMVQISDRCFQQHRPTQNRRELLLLNIFVIPLDARRAFRLVHWPVERVDDAAGDLSPDISERAHMKIATRQRQPEHSDI